MIYLRGITINKSPSISAESGPFNFSALSSQLGSFTKSELNSLFDLSRSFNEVPESLKKMKQFSQQMSGEFKRRNLDDPNKINEDMGLKEGTDSIAGGGKKMTNINISLENGREHRHLF